GVQIFRDFDGIGSDHFAVERSFLDTERHTVVIETRVGEGEDKAATGFDDLANAAHQGVDLSHVHDRHIADSGVEALLPQGYDLLLASSIEEGIFDEIGVLTGAGASTFEELRTEISSDDVDTERGHAAGKDAIATGDLEHRFAGLQAEQPFTRGTNEDALEVVAVAHFFIPEGSFLVPNVARFFIQINWLPCVFGSHRSWFPFWHIRCVDVLNNAHLHLKQLITVD